MLAETRNKFSWPNQATEVDYGKALSLHPAGTVQRTKCQLAPMERCKTNFLIFSFFFCAKFVQNFALCSGRIKCVIHGYAKTTAMHIGRVRRIGLKIKEFSKAFSKAAVSSIVVWLEQTHILSYGSIRITHEMRQETQRGKNHQDSMPLPSDVQDRTKGVTVRIR